jgi:hypothetical protein
MPPAPTRAAYRAALVRKRNQRAKRTFIDPLAPLSGRALRRQVTQDVQAATQPVTREISKSITSAAEAGARNIGGVSEALARGLAGGPQEQREIYERARTTMQELDRAVAGRLGVGGEAIAGDLEQRLGAAGLPTQEVEALRAATRGAAGAGFARGSAETVGLTQQQAGAESYAAKLPGFARLGGLQAIAQRRAQAQQDLTQQLGQVRAAVPGMVSEGMSRGRQLEFEKGIARVGLQSDIAEMGSRERQNAADNAAAAARARQAEAGRTQRARESERGRMARAEMSNAVAEANAAERVRHNRQLERDKAAGRRTKAAAARKPNASLSRAYGYIVDATGNPIKDRNGKRIPVAKTSTTKGKRGGFRTTGD